MKNASKMLVALVALFCATTVSAQSKKTSTRTLGPGESLLINTLPTGLSDKGISWPSWVITRADTFSFITQMLSQLKSENTSLNGKIVSLKKALKDSAKSLRGYTDVVAQKQRNDEQLEKLQITYDSLKFADILAKQLDLKSEVSDSMAFIQGQIENLANQSDSLAGLVDSVNGKIDTLGKNYNKCSSYMKTHVKFKSEGRVRREARRDAYLQRTGKVPAPVDINGSNTSNSKGTKKSKGVPDGAMEVIITDNSGHPVLDSNGNYQKVIVYYKK